MSNPLRETSSPLIMNEPEDIPISRSRLSWTPLESNIIISGDTEMNSLKNIKNTVLSIRRQFSTNSDPKVHLNPLNRDEVNKRLILLESEVQGLMRRKINLNIEGDQGQPRSLDYTNLLNQKQNQVIELQKKIQNLEFQLRKHSARQIELQNHIVYLNDELRIKEEIINGKNEIILAEVANSNALTDVLNQIRRNVDVNKTKIQDLEKIVLDQIEFPQVGSSEIKAQTLMKSGSLARSTTYQQLPLAQKFKTRVVQVFREVERIMNSQNGQINEMQFERILQGFLMSQKQSKLYQKSMIAAKRTTIEERYHRLRENFAIAAGIYHDNLEKLKRDNPNVRINFERNLFEILQLQNVKAYQVQNGAVFIDAYTEKIVEVPVQDARTKHLIHLFAQTLKKFTSKYPQLLKEMDPKLVEFFQQQVIDMIEVDQVDKLVNIVKYVPQVVKVENVYAYSSQKTRKVEFHLRVLIKALLEELQKIKMKTGIVLEMDQGVLGMISSEIMGLVNVDDILKVFRPVPKIVQVQKIVQKIVEKRVQVPIVVPITKEIQKIVQVQKIVEVQKIVNVPLQVPVIQTQIVQKIVPVEQIIQQVIEVPTIVERIVYVNQEVAKVVEVPTFVEKVVEVEKIVEVEKVVNHIQQQPEEIQVIRQKIVPVQKIVEKIIEVPVIKEKIVEKIVEVPTIEIIQRIVEKAVPIIEYRKALEVSNHIETIHKPVDRIVQKIVPVIKTIQRIVQVPQVIQKIVEVIVEKVQIKEVEVIKEKLIRQEVIKPVEVIVKEIVQVVRQVPVEVEKIIEIPVVQEVIKKVQQIIEKPIIQRVENTVIKEVYLRDPMIVYQPKLVEVQKVINHYVQVPKPVRYVEEKIIEIPRNVQKIKEVRIEVQKIVEKMVEVPKVVEVQKVVERIVVVPRVIEKVVQVPQIIQKIVYKQVQKIVVKQVEKQVQIPVIQEKIVEVETVRNVYIEVEKPVDRVVEKLVTITNKEQKVVTQQIRVQNVVEVISQVPKNLYIDKIVPAYYEQVKPVQIEKIVIVPREIAVPVEVVVQKLIPVREIFQKVIQVPQFIEKIVETKNDNVKIQYIQKVVEKIVVDQKIKEVQKIVPYIQEVIKEIPTIVQKIVTVQSKVQEIITAQQIIQKIVERSTIVPRIYQVQKIVPKLIKVPQIIEVERIIPQVIRVNEYIQKIVEKVVQVPRIIERIRQIEVQKQKVVAVTNVKSELVQVEKIVEKIAILQQMKEVIKNVNHIEKVVKIVEQIERIPVQISVKQEILVEIPYILEKIVQKIVVMPQIVEVLKYVHEIAESNELLTVQDEKQFESHQLKLVQLMRNIKPALDELLISMRTLKNTDQVSGKVSAIQNFLTEFDKLIAFPKLIRIKGKEKPQRTKEIEQKIVKVPVQSEHDLRKQISMSILIEKLIVQIKRIFTKTNEPLQLDDEIKMIFFPQLQSANRYSLEGDLKDKFNKFAQQISRKFQTFGPWAEESQLMLNTILEERFKLAQIIETANIQIQRAKIQYENALNLLDQQTRANRTCQEHLNRLKSIFLSYSKEKQEQLPEIQRFIEDIEARQTQIEPIMKSEAVCYLRSQLIESQMIPENIQSKIRQKDATIEKLKSTIATLQRSGMGESKIVRYDEEYVKTLQRQIQQLRQGRLASDSRLDLSNIQQTFKKDIVNLQQKNNMLETQNSELRTSLDNTSRELRILHQNERFLMRRDQNRRVGQTESLQESAVRQSTLLEHSEIRRTDGSFLSQSQYSLYQQKPQESGEGLEQSQSTAKKPELKEEEQTMRTPFELYKFRSPLSTDIKQTQSFLKQESVTAQSPKGHTLFTPASMKREYERQDQFKRKQEQQQGSKQDSSYYSPESKEESQKKQDPK